MCSLTRPQLQLLYQRKLEALKCGPDLFWPQKSNLFNSKISSFLSRALTQTTTPIGINYISEKACEKKWNQSVLEHFPRHLIVPNQEIQWNASTHIQQAIRWQPAKSIHMPDTTSIFGAHRWARCHAVHTAWQTEFAKEFQNQWPRLFASAPTPPGQVHSLHLLLFGGMVKQ